MAAHSIADLDGFYRDTKTLHEEVILGKADSIIKKMDQTIDFIKANWRGSDATKNINSIIMMRNEMVRQRNLLDAISAGLCNIAVSYRQIQIVNLGNLPELRKFNGTKVPEIQEFSDNYNGEDVKPGLANARTMLSDIYSNINGFINQANSIKTSIFANNYTEGPDRQNAIDSFDKFKTIFDSTFVPEFRKVDKNIDTAASNYGV